MNKQYLLIFLLLFPILYTNAQNNRIEEELKNKSNAEIVEVMQEFAEKIADFDNFFFRFSSFKGEDEIKEKTIDPFVLDTLNAINQLENAKFDRLSLLQTFTDSCSKIKVEKTWSTIKEHSDTYDLYFTPKKIFFYDGTVATDKLDELEIDFSFPEEWPFKKRIDSLECEIKLKYVKDFDIININAINSKANYKGKFIKLKAINENVVEYMHDESIDIFLTEGLNKEGKPLNQSSYISTRYSNYDFGLMAGLKDPLQALIKKAEKDTLLPNEKFRNKYIQEFQELFSKKPQASDTIYKKVEYDGLVKSLKIYIIKNEKSIIANRIIKSTDFEDIHVEYSDSLDYLCDNNGNRIFTLPEDFYQINSNFYEDNKFYYYFNSANNQLDTLKYYSIEKLTGQFVKAQEDEYEEYILLDNKNNLVGTFDAIDEREGVISAYKDKDVLIIAPIGTQKWIENIDKLGKFNNGFAVIVINQKYGFIDKTGNIIIPAIYDGAEEFGDMTTYTSKDNLFPVRKGEVWGFVDINNKTVIPFEYEDAMPFSYGITMVKFDGRNRLINTSNQTIAPVGGGSYSLSTNFGKRMYYIGEKYDYLGRKLKDDEW